MRLQEVIPINPVASSLEELGALGGTGLYKIKPFKDWKGAPVWKEKIFTFRLCNAGEILDIASTVKSTSENERIIDTKIEVLSRALHLVNESPLISQEELTKYNENNKTEFSSQREWIAVYLKNLENVVLNRLYAIYEALEYKQIRQLQGVVQSGINGVNYPKALIPEGSLYLQYSLPEILTSDEIANNPDYLESFDIEEKKEKEVASVPEVEVEKPNTGDSFEERKQRREEEGS
jgi:hypothetical protein